jgi:hypothetical protein
MFGPLQAVFWIAEHWWIFAIVAAVALAALLWTGVVQLAAVVIAIARIAAAIAAFFAKPAEQIAAKILYGFCVAVIALSAGYQHGSYVTNAKWHKAEAAHAAAMARLKDEAAAEAKQQVENATAAEREKTVAAQKGIADYEAKLATLPAGDSCRIGDDDLRAAGVPNAGNRAGVDRHPKRLQRLTPHR